MIDSPDRLRRPRRLWPQRLAASLNVRLRKVQEWRNEPGFPDPDLADDLAVGEAWVAHERAVRAWVEARHPWIARNLVAAQFPERGPRAPAASASVGLTGIPKPAATAAPDDHRKWFEAETAAIDHQTKSLALAERSAQLVRRSAVVAYAQGALAASLRGLDDLVALLLERLPPEARVEHRAAITAALDDIKSRQDPAHREVWRATIPKVPTGAAS